MGENGHFLHIWPSKRALFKIDGVNYSREMNLQGCVPMTPMDHLVVRKVGVKGPLYFT